MLSLEKCRALIPSHQSLSDAELTLLRDQLYGLADVSVNLFLELKRRRDVSSPSNSKIQTTSSLTHNDMGKQL